MSDTYIYKALTPEAWATLDGRDSFEGSALDRTDGFIHTSRAAQLKETLDKWYADRAEVVLLQVESAALGETLVYEPSRGGEDFPHIFGPLPMSAVRKRWVVSPTGGVYSLPDDLKAN